MAYTIQYLSNGKEVAETPWHSDVPPSTRYARQGLRLRAADTAIIRDEVGKHLVAVKERAN
ncbi:MAG TPA: hypothetical protein VJS47_09530 [Rhizomicrobium sp.]|nr:hypothetical protein [Rhizomicrobium sp.]